MSKLNKQFIVPILIVVIGIGWLLNVQGVIPNVDWVWTCGLAAAGALMLSVGGINKLTVVIGPFLIVAAVLSVFRQTGKLSIDMEVPILTILLGVLLIIVNALKLPSSEILKED